MNEIDHSFLPQNSMKNAAGPHQWGTVLLWGLRILGLALFGLTSQTGSLQAQELFPVDADVQTVASTRDLTIYRVGKADPDEPAVVLLDPVLFRPNILFRKNGLIPTFRSNDYNVYLMLWHNGREVHPDEPEQEGAEIEKTLALIRTDCGCQSFVLGGLSLGGQRWLPYLSRLATKGDSMEDRRGNVIDAVFFLGVGLDYSYPQSLYNRNSPIGQDLSHNCETTEAPCLSFIGTKYFAAGLRLNRIPEPVAPTDLATIRMYPAIQSMTIPGAFIYGKIDGFSPEESIYPIYRAWGAETYIGKARSEFAPYDSDNPALWLELSEANLEEDFNHFDLFLHPDADDAIYEPLIDWIEDAERQSNYP
ncbi:MAG: hypothetical protein KDK37_08035 [Leptospiraceae bacterium]|nr:hypothetical protein [Leptospiraceae bacterium]